MTRNINGKEIELKLGVRALEEIESRLGCDLQGIFKKISEPKTSELKLVFWASLLYKNRDITLDDSLELAEGVGTIEDLQQLINDLIKEAWPKTAYEMEQEEEEDEDPGKKSQIGNDAQ